MTTQDQFDEYTRTGEHMRRLMDGSVRSDEVTTLLATPVTLPDGWRVTLSGLTASDITAIRDYMYRHAQALQDLARPTRLECEVVRPDLAEQIDWPEDQL